MNPGVSNADVSLIASPYDLRVSLGAKVTELDIRSALESGECGLWSADGLNGHSTNWSIKP